MEGDFDLGGLDALLRSAGLPVARVLAVIGVVPIFGPGNPARLQKFGLGLVIAFAAISARGWDALQDPGPDPVRYALLFAREVLFGVLLGWVANLVFEAVRIAGTLIATEMGLNMASQVDPVTRASQPLLAHLFQSLAFVVFFAAGGPGLILGAVIRSFDGVAPGSFAPGPEMADAILAFTAAMMAAALRIAAPVFVLLVVLTVCVGFLAKIAPSLNILEASYPLRILGAFLLLVLFLPVMMDAFDAFLGEAGGQLFRIAGGRP